MKTVKFRNAKCAIILLLAIFLTTTAIAETNVSILYGWNGTAFAPVNIESDGSLKTTLNLSESIGIFPKDDSLYNLGSNALKWLTGYFSNVSATQVCIGASCRTTWPSGGGSAWDISTSVYLFNNSDILDVNETKLNETIDARDTNVSLQYGYNGTNWLGLRTTPSGILKFQVDNTSYLARDGDTATGDYTFDTTTFHIDSGNDRVGIGTSSPNSTFQVAGNITPTLNNTYSLGEPDLVWKDVYVANDSLYIGGKQLSNTQGTLFWDGTEVASGSNMWTNSSGAATFSGNVGIGTTIPSQKLHVEGNLNVTGEIYTSSLYLGNSALSNSAGTLAWGGSTTLANNISGTAANASAGDSATSFFSSGTLEDDRLSFTLQDAVTDGGCTDCITDGMVSNTLTASQITCSGCVAEGEIAQNTLDDSEIATGGIGADSLAADSVADSELMNGGTWTTSSDLAITGGGGVNAFSVDSPTFSVDATNNRVGIGTTTPGGVFHAYVNDNDGFRIEGNGASSSLILDSMNDNAATRDWAIRNRYSSYGIFEIMVSSTQGGSPTTARLAITSDGTFTGSASNDISDERLKENIVTVENSLDRITQLRGVRFTWNEEANMHNRPQFGVIAQEVEPLFPELVLNTSIFGDGYKSVQYGGFVAPFIEAIKELKIENDELKQRISALEKQ